MRTVKEAAAALGIDGNTLRDWIRKAGAGDRLDRDPVDARLVYVPDDLIEQLAAAHKRRLVYNAPDLASEVADLRRRVEALERKAALGSLSAKSERANEKYPPSDDASPQAPESAHTRASRGSLSAGGDIPDGWIHAVTFAKAIGVHQNTFDNWVRLGRVPVTRRPDLRRTDGKDQVLLTPEQQAAAREYARERGRIS